MSHARVPLFSLVVALGGTASLFACATGDDSFQLGALSPVGTQSQGDDGGTLLEAGGEDALTLPSPSTPTPTMPADDAASPSPSDDAGLIPPAATQDAAAPPSIDAAPPPVVDAALPPPVVDSGPAATCTGYAAPDTPAGCDCDPTKHPCTANGCYGGYYCKLSTLGCFTKPSGC